MNVTTVPQAAALSLFGWCQDTTRPDSAHDRCPDRIVDRLGRQHVCSCPNHSPSSGA